MLARLNLIDAIISVAEIAKASLEAQIDAGTIPTPEGLTSDNVTESVDTVPGPDDNAATVSRLTETGMEAEEFTRLRKATGFTQAEAAEVLKVAPRTISRWETSRSRIDVWKAKEIRFLLKPGMKEWHERMKAKLDKMAHKYDNLSGGQPDPS